RRRTIQIARDRRDASGGGLDSVERRHTGRIHGDGKESVATRRPRDAINSPVKRYATIAPVGGDEQAAVGHADGVRDALAVERPLRVGIRWNIESRRPAWRILEPARLTLQSAPQNHTGPWSE